MIDWKEQWSLHSRYYRDGLVQINLKQFGGPERLLKLEPGPGFGDLSHPTTRLTLKMMLPLIKGQVVLDIGCGSGILALAAKAAGAEWVYGIDIDQEALEHAQKNARLNGLEIIWEAPDKLRDGPIALMNMIRCEQADAWESLRALHPQITTKVTSGVLVEEKELYLAEQKDWRVEKITEEEGWLAFSFRSCKNPDSCRKGSIRP